MKIKFNTKGIDDLLKSLDNIEDTEVAAGIFQEDGEHSSGLHKAALLSMQELGVEGMYPARPVLKLTAQEEGVSWGEKATKDLGRALEKTKLKVKKSDAVKALKDVSKDMEQDIKDNFGSSKLPANAPSTISRKGGNNPLIETGELRDSINSKVRRRK